MNEDIKDIIEILELAKEEIENNDENITATLDLQDLKSLKNLYELYNKEKDLNNELQIRYKIEHEKYLEEKEKNKELEECLEVVSKELDNIAYDQILFVIKEKYISKDKIRELKQKIDKEHDKAIIEFMRKKENFIADGDVAQTLNWVSGQLEELLEERN